MGLQIEKHYANNSFKLEMLLHKLQLITTSSARLEKKAQWLVWWNGSSLSRAAQKISTLPVSENTATESRFSRIAFFAYEIASKSWGLVGSKSSTAGATAIAMARRLRPRNFAASPPSAVTCAAAVSRSRCRSRLSLGSPARLRIARYSHYRNTGT